MTKKPRRKVNKTGRNEEYQYWQLPYSLAQSDAMRRLSGPALKVLIELRCRFNGFNNGRIILSYEEGAHFLGLSKTSVKRAFDELAAVGFIKLKKKGQWYGRKASEWIVTMIALDGYLATNEWKQWKPLKPLKPTRKTIPRYRNGIPECIDGAE